MSTLTLYQFELCPYCHKVKAGLELKGIPYRKVEVNPMSKHELAKVGPNPDGRKKVPVIEFKGDVVRESSTPPTPEAGPCSPTTRKAKRSRTKSTRGSTTTLLRFSPPCFTALGVNP